MADQPPSDSDEDWTEADFLIMLLLETRHPLQTWQMRLIERIMGAWDERIIE